MPWITTYDETVSKDPANNLSKHQVKTRRKTYDTWEEATVMRGLAIMQGAKNVSVDFKEKE